ncbi:MAG: site-2 protease family protein [Thermodesulfobacteriota bacterium]
MFDLDYKFLIIFVPVILFSLTIHEYAHAYIANKLGDDTAKRLGRLTLNPLKHLDPLGTILLLLVHFGWAKPVPVDPRNCKNPKKDMLYVAIAGPISNILTAIVAAVILKFFVLNAGGAGNTASFTDPMIQLLVWLIFIGVVLAVFNMLPFPPLDGSRVLYGLLPDSMGDSIKKIETYGILIIFGLILLGGKYFSIILIYPFFIFIHLFGFNNYELNLIANVIFNR